MRRWGSVFLVAFAAAVAAIPPTDGEQNLVQAEEARIPPVFSSPNPSLMTPGPGYYDLSEFFAGRVAVGIFLVESVGSAYDWTDAELDETLNGIYDGLSWWAAQEPRARLSFSYEVYVRQPTTWEPIQNSLADAWMWIDEVMSGLGYVEPDPWPKTLHFNNDLRNRLGADWAYSIFVADSDDAVNMGRFTNNQYAYAYYGGPWLTMSRYSSWAYNSADYFRVVPAHETGHIFYATDEYDANPVEYSGYLNCPDQNGATGIMNRNTLSVSASTRCQLGWRDSDSDGILDILDVPPHTALAPYTPDPTSETRLDYQGMGTVVPLQNQNPKGQGNDVTTSAVTSVDFRIDGGPWTVAQARDGAFGDFEETFIFTTPVLGEGTHTVEAISRNNEGNTDPTPGLDPVTILGSFAVDAGPDLGAQEGTSIAFEGLISGTSPDSLNWTKESGVRVNPGATYDSVWTFQPNIVPYSGGYRMYYTGSDGATRRILSATSTDQVAWTKESGVRVDAGGTYDSNYAYTPEVITLQNGTLRMYYTGYTGTFRVLSALSVDGVSWQKEPGIRIDAGGPYDSNGGLSPDLVPLPAGGWRMYYAGSDGGTFRILSATSTDGLTWSKESGIRIDRGGPYDSAFVESSDTIQLPDGRLRLFYHGGDSSRSRILSAVSSDGLNWVKEPGVRVNVGGPYDGASLGYPEVVPSPIGNLRMFYTGSDGSVLRIISATPWPPVVSAWWDFDIAVDSGTDGTPDNDVEATGLQASYTHWDDGTYVARLCASSSNSSGCDTVNVTVANLAPSQVLSGPAHVSIGSPRGFSASATDPGSDDLRFAWDWGDSTANSSLYFNDGSSPDPSPSSDGTAPFSVIDVQIHAWQAVGSYSVAVTASDDDQGNASASLTVNVHPLPTTALRIGVPRHLGTWEYLTSVTSIDFDATDYSGFGIERTEYRIDGGGWSTYVSGTPARILDQGLHLVEYRSIDAIGGIGAIGSSSLFVDETAPESSATIHVKMDTAFVNLTSADYGCGVQILNYSLDGGPWRPYGGNFTMVGYGLHTVRYGAIDCLGNVEPDRDASVLISPPETNYKPAIAMIFALVIFLTAVFRRQRTRVASWRLFLVMVAAFAGAEMATGVLSLMTGLLSIPPILGVGLAVDLGILAGGIAVLLLLSRTQRALASPPPPKD